MNNGISIYPGLDNLLEENLKLIELAATCGIKRIFTSFNIPEINKENFKRELDIILNIAKNNDMEIISDVSPKTRELLDIDVNDLKGVKNLGISTIRLDDGYNAEEIAKLSRNTENIGLQLNASAITQNFLNDLEKHNTNFNAIEALHNFYPRINTGLSEEFFANKNNLLKSYDIKVGAFISSEGKKRGPIFEGICTLEAHRGINSSLAMRHLAALGVDFIFISESLPFRYEIEELARLENNEVILKINMFTKNSAIKNLLSNKFTARPDESRDVIRAKESRLLAKGNIDPENAVDRPLGSITVDNALYKRYMGELQITKRDLPKDERVNVIAEIAKDELFMLKYVTPEKKFYFKE